jgi:putative ABC transport system permease protein
LRMMLAYATRLAALGAAIGLGAAWLLTPLLESQLYGVRPSDPMTFVAVPLLLIGVAGIAAFGPARRAMRVDPVQAMRYE